MIKENIHSKLEKFEDKSSVNTKNSANSETDVIQEVINNQNNNFSKSEITESPVFNNILSKSIDTSENFENPLFNDIYQNTIEFVDDNNNIHTENQQNFHDNLKPFKIEMKDNQEVNNYGIEMNNINQVNENLDSNSNLNVNVKIIDNSNLQKEQEIVKNTNTDGDINDTSIQNETAEIQTDKKMSETVTKKADLKEFQLHFENVIENDNSNLKMTEFQEGANVKDNNTVIKSFQNIDDETVKLEEINTDTSNKYSESNELIAIKNQLKILNDKIKRNKERVFKDISESDNLEITQKPKNTPAIPNSNEISIKI